MNTKQDYIGVFDSGLGGLSVLRHLRRLLPGERFLYYGDSAHAPYGTKSPAQVRELTLAAGAYLMEQGLKALVVACNTATSAAIDTLRETYPGLIVVGIEPALKPAADRFPGGAIGVMATPMTLQEEKFSGLLARYQQQCRVYKLPAPGLVELVEAGRANSQEAVALLRRLFVALPEQLDALVLGCTHYPFAQEAIRACLGDQVELLEGGEGTARETRRRLAQAGLLEEGSGELRMENSKQSPALLDLGRKLLK